MNYQTYESIFENTVLPKRMCVVGAGPIGCEIGQAYARFGAQVTLVGPKILPKEEIEVHQTLEKSFKEEGIAFVKGKAYAVDQKANEIVVRVKDPTISNSNLSQITCDMLFVAGGRKPKVGGLGLEKIGIKLNKNGGIKTDEVLRTNIPNIFAAGDVLGGLQFT